MTETGVVGAWTANPSYQSFEKTQNLCSFQRLKASVSLTTQPRQKSWNSFGVGGGEERKPYLHLQQITSLLSSRAVLTHDPLSGCVGLTCHQREREEVFNTGDKSEQPRLSAIMLTLHHFISKDRVYCVCVCETMPCRSTVVLMVLYAENIPHSGRQSKQSDY